MRRRHAISIFQTVQQDCFVSTDTWMIYPCAPFAPLEELFWIL